jgi:hypothetical protein
MVIGVVHLIGDGLASIASKTCPFQPRLPWRYGQNKAINLIYNKYAQDWLT